MTFFVRARKKPGTGWSEVQLNPTNLLVVEFEYTAEELKASGVREVIEAPDDNEMIFPVTGILGLKFRTTPFPSTGNEGSVSFEVGPSGSGLFKNSFLSATEDKITFLDTSYATTTPDQLLGQPLYLKTHWFAPVTEWEIKNGGSDYAVNDTGVILSNGEDPAHYKVTSISAGGHVTGIEITDQGGELDYSEGANTATESGAPQAGSGTGLSVHAAASDLTNVVGDSDLSGSIVYNLAKVKL